MLDGGASIEELLSGYLKLSERMIDLASADIDRLLRQTAGDGFA